ncbi:MAG TPA: hypothetical protein PLU49_12805 [Saprospiraceae bacterium]|nr:hypothetical protein [Saprospiraceae bacterium]
MNDKNFYLSLVTLTIIVFGAIYWIHLNTVMAPYFNFSAVGIAIMVGYNILAYYVGKKLMNSRKKYIFLNFVLANIFLKIAVVMLYIMSYVKFNEPSEKLFLLPFVGIYLVYAVFETYFLYQMVNLKQRKDEQI